jgi:hypothetical protein
MNNNTNNTNTTITTGTNANGSSQNSSQGGSDVGGLSAISRQILGQQAELLAKLEIVLESQARLELALQSSVLASNAALGITTGRKESSANV